MHQVKVYGFASFLEGIRMCGALVAAKFMIRGRGLEGFFFRPGFPSLDSFGFKQHDMSQR